jgi:hypothetical protein
MFFDSTLHMDSREDGRLLFKSTRWCCPMTTWRLIMGHCPVTFVGRHFNPLLHVRPPVFLFLPSSSRASFIFCLSLAKTNGEIYSNFPTVCWRLWVAEIWRVPVLRFKIWRRLTALRRITSSLARSPPGRNYQRLRVSSFDPPTNRIGKQLIKQRKL